MSDDKGDTGDWAGRGRTAGPRVRMTAPDGQMLTARLVAWERAPDGTWWAVCALTLWSQLVDTGGETRGEPW